jgi:hypothetical protein
MSDVLDTFELRRIAELYLHADYRKEVEWFANQVDSLKMQAANDEQECKSLRARLATYEAALVNISAGITEFIRCAELAEMPGYIVTKDTWECGECSAMDGSDIYKTREEVKHDPDCYQGACEKIMKLPKLAADALAGKSTIADRLREADAIIQYAADSVANNHMPDEDTFKCYLAKWKERG